MSNQVSLGGFVGSHTGQDRGVQIPISRGPLSSGVFAAMRGAPHLFPAPPTPQIPAPRSEDFQITLWILQELTFRPIDGVNPGWEDEPWVVALRTAMERAQESELRRELVRPVAQPDAILDAIQGLINGGDGPSLSRWMHDYGALRHMQEFAVHRAAYQLKEADPHSLAIPRLAAGRAKSALLKIQLDEYGNAEPGQSHAEVFAHTMRALGVALDVDALPAVTLRTNTVLNMLASRRRSLGACIGHLAVFEMTSVEPMARYAATLRRVLPEADATSAARFYDLHVAADGFHEQLAADELITGFVEQYPDEANEVLFGAAAVMSVENDLTRYLLDAWTGGLSSLRSPSECVAA